MMFSSFPSIQIRSVFFRPVLLGFFLLIAVLSACTPGTRTMTEVTASPESQALERTAQLAYHKMETAKIETGRYDTGVLTSLDLPRGVLWQLKTISEEGYEINFVSSDVPGFAYIVTPEGVRLVPAS
ncbi:MAG: hypothetical protein ACRCYY_20710 [Trueperaceae bacterium]